MRPTFVRHGRSGLLARNLPKSRIATIFRTVTQRFLNSATHTLSVMWIDDTSADVIKVDFEALYHGDFLVEGDTSEQFDDYQELPTAV